MRCLSVVVDIVLVVVVLGDCVGVAGMVTRVEEAPYKKSCTDVANSARRLEN